MTKSVAIIGVVNAALALALAFGVDLTQEQTAAIVGVVNAGLIVAAAFLDPKIPFGRIQ